MMKSAAAKVHGKKDGKKPRDPTDDFEGQGKKKGLKRSASNPERVALFCLRYVA